MARHLPPVFFCSRSFFVDTVGTDDGDDEDDEDDDGDLHNVCGGDCEKSKSGLLRSPIDKEIAMATAIMIMGRGQGSSSFWS